MRLHAESSIFDLSDLEIKNQYAVKVRSYLAAARQKYGEAPAIYVTNTIDGSSPPLNFVYIVDNVWTEGVERPDEDSMPGCEKCSPDMGQGIGCEYTAKCDCLEYAHVNEHNLKTPAQWDQYRNPDERGTAGLPKLFPYRRAAGSWEKKVCPLFPPIPFYMTEKL
jgi:histone-lysine N-methyltransferase SUV39H